MLDQLEHWLGKYPDEQEAKLLMSGFRHGFRIQYQGKRVAREANNHGSARRRPEIVEQKLMQEVQLGRVAGPFTNKPLQNLIVSPIGLVEKNIPGEFRLIFDLSFPQADSINGGIPAEAVSVAYTSFDAVTNMVRRLGTGTHLIKVDIKAAFRLLPLHPDDFSLMGMKHKDTYFVDKALPFGCSISCALFEKFSTFLEWCAKSASGSTNLIHYLDDFCGGEKSEEEAAQLLSAILEVFSCLGVPVAPEKVEGPSTCLKFLGLVVDTIAMEVRIPDDKVTSLRQQIRSWLEGRKKVTLKELQSLIGKLNFACRAVVPGRAFCRRLIDAMRHASKPHHRIRITTSMKEDLQIWDQFLHDFNGRSIMLKGLWVDNDGLDLYTDAAGSIGFGAYFQGHWSCGVWPAHWQQQGPDITFKELFPIVLALHLWGCQLKNHKVIFHCDNQAVVHIINKQSSRSGPSMQLLRLLVLTCLENNLLFKAKHIPGHKNGIADALSRGQLHRFRALAPVADSCPTEIPDPILRLFQLK